MKPAPFVYHTPTTLAEAVRVLAEVRPHAKVLAGGQSLIPILNMRLASPAHLVDINGIAGLDRIQLSDRHVRVGALVRHTQLERDTSTYAVLPLLRQALVNVAHPVIRNRGTVVGSIAHADPAGELPAVLALTDGVVEALGPAGLREIASRDFFEGPLETSLDTDELVQAVRFGLLPPGTGTAFVESARRQGDYAVAGVAAAVTLRAGAVQQARVSFVSVTPVPSVLDLTDLVAGRHASGVDWSLVEEAVAAHIDPDGDIHASADYRRMLAAALTGRALAQASTRHTQDVVA